MISGDREFSLEKLASDFRSNRNTIETGISGSDGSREAGSVLSNQMILPMFDDFEKSEKWLLVR